MGKGGGGWGMASNEAQVYDNENQANSTLGCDTLTDKVVGVQSAK